MERLAFEHLGVLLEVILVERNEMMIQGIIVLEKWEVVYKKIFLVY